MKHYLKLKTNWLTFPMLVMGWFIGISVANADPDTGYGHMWGEGWGAGHMTFGIFPMALFWLGLVIFVVILIRWSATDNSGSSTLREKSAMDILKERFARGEIDTSEYEEAKRVLND